MKIDAKAVDQAFSAMVASPACPRRVWVWVMEENLSQTLPLLRTLGSIDLMERIVVEFEPKVLDRPTLGLWSWKVWISNPSWPDGPDGQAQIAYRYEVGDSVKGSLTAEIVLPE